MRLHAVLAILAAALVSAACQRSGESNPVAPGSPGTGNAPVSTAPAAGDTPPGGPSGVKGSLPHTGSSGGDAVPGTTGRGTPETGQAGASSGGLHGGLGPQPTGTPTQALGAGAATRGSANRTTGSTR